jgi:hypothetical protein
VLGQQPPNGFFSVVAKPPPATHHPPPHPRVRHPFTRSQLSSVHGDAHTSLAERTSVAAFTLRKLLIRHTKDQVLGGEAVLRLPPITHEDVPVVLNADERAAYLETYAAASAAWRRLAAAGPAVVSRHLLQANTLLLPLRRICSGGGRLAAADLAVREIELSEEHAAAAEANLKAREDAAAAGGSGGSSGGAGDVGGLSLPPLLVPNDVECCVCLDGLQVCVRVWGFRKL